MALIELTLVSIKSVIIISWKNYLIHWRLFYMFCKNHSPYTKHLICNIVVQNKNNMQNTRRATSYLKCIMILQKTMTCIFLLFAFHRENSYSKRPSLRLCSLFRGRDILTFGKCMLDLLSVWNKQHFESYHTKRYNLFYSGNLGELFLYEAFQECLIKEMEQLTGW